MLHSIPDFLSTAKRLGLSPQHIPAHRDLIRLRPRSYEAIVVLAGLCYVKWTNYEQDMTFLILGAGHSVFLNEDEQYTLHFVEPSEVIQFPLMDLYDQSPNLLHWLLQDQHQQLTERLSVLLILNRWERYKCLRGQHSDWFLSFPNQVLAQYLGISRQHFQAIQARWLREGGR